MSAKDDKAGKRRGRGEGSLHWDAARQRWIGTVTVGYAPNGKRIVRKVSDKDKAKARTKLKEKIREHDDGVLIATNSATVADAVTDWLTYGLTGTGPSTVANYGILARSHIVPHLGKRKLRELTATDVDRWLLARAKVLSTRTVRLVYSILRRSIHRAMARDKVKRNVVELCGIPTGQGGRPSKSLTLDQAKQLLVAAEGSTLHAYIVVSLLTGARTEELRPLTWDLVDLDGVPDADPAIPPSIQVWRSVRADGDTKTRKSRRTLALPARCVFVLRQHRAGVKGDLDGRLVFASSAGTELDRHNVLRAFRLVAKRAGLEPAQWTPRELRHSFVSLLSDNGLPIEAIADLCGHSSTNITETVYRHQLRPVIQDGAIAMDRIFGTADGG
ncbi:site-specific integrase [Virgisporangium ochraceum]|uniref:Site-specific integrase n=1 Tax=Virgisporangium ochraceum TaxID=65505 RepID=A0A8J4EE48_9ACTN|nr:site-specific integrase [Virgisporangium ochraceum]GIJ71248.1 site-specific integrase [Virgisporangium ochraceum]